MRIHVAMAAAAACVLAATSANSADIAAPVVEPVAVAPDWSGFYVGANAGYAWGNVEASDPALVFGGVVGIAFPGLSTGFDADGFLGGLQAGAQIQNGSFVLGVEGDVSFSGIDEKNDLFPGVGVSAEVQWLSTLRARVGHAFDNFLVYATGGLAVAEVEGGIYVDPIGYHQTDEQTHVGWTAGAGVEAMVTENISLKVEYLYADLGQQDYEIPLIPGVPNGAIDLHADGELDMHIVRVGANYRF